MQNLPNDPYAHILGKAYFGCADFPKLKEIYREEVEKQSNQGRLTFTEIRKGKIGFTEIRNESHVPLNCGGERIFHGMSALFAYSCGGVNLKIDTGQFQIPLFERQVWHYKINEYGQQEKCEEDVPFFNALKDVDLSMTGYDTTFTITDATDEEVQEIFETFDGYMNNSYEYQVNRHQCLEFYKYSEDPDLYKGDEGFRRTFLMVKVNQTAIETLSLK